MDNKFLDSIGLKYLWKKILQLLDQKLDSVEAADKSILVASRRNISVKISNESSNALQLKDGLYVPKNHKLIFGAHGEFVYDGTQDVTVPVYDGEYNINN